jgi:antitoxin MazE
VSQNIPLTIPVKKYTLCLYIDAGGIMKSTVQKWGNSLAIRIPKSFATEIDLSQGAEIDLVLFENKIQIEPIKKKNLTLDELLSQVTEENIHGEVDTGAPVGKEIW